MKRLKDMLSYMRPHESVAERDWVDRFIMPYDPEVFGEKGVPYAYSVTVHRKDGSLPRVLFSSHVDTVHKKSGRQRLVVGERFISKNDGRPLGADDAAGVWLLLEMIDAGVPGTYIFHRGEECGGIGSRWMAKNGVDWLQRFDYAIAFDRKATDSIITHQGGTRTCSDEFAEALSEALNESEDEFMYSPDDTGVFTDTKCYVKLIPECTNVSVGYYDEHRAAEKLDFVHLLALRNACVNLDWHALPHVRDPNKVETKSRWPAWSTGKYPTTGTVYPVTGSLEDEDLEVEFDDIQKYFEARYGNWRKDA